MFRDLHERRISCPFCGEAMFIALDPSAGGQSYIEDCQICCQPMQITYETEGDELLGLTIERAQ